MSPAPGQPRNDAEQPLGRGSRIGSTAFAWAFAAEGRDYQSHFEQIVVEALKAWPRRLAVDPRALALYAEREGAVREMPIHVVMTLLRRLEKRGLVARSKAGGLYPRREALLKVTSLAERRNRALARFERLRDALSAYANREHGLGWFESHSESALEQFIDEFGSDLALAGRHGWPREVPEAVAGSALGVVYEFALWASAKELKSWDDLVALARGTMIYNVVYYAGVVKVSNRLPRLTAYLDTSVVLRRLGLAAPTDTAATEQTQGLVEGVDARTAVFHHTVTEVRGILERISAKLRRGRERDGSWGSSCQDDDALDAAISQDWDADDIDALNDEIYTRLEQLGIDVDWPPPHREEGHLDEAKLARTMAAVVGYRSLDALRKDLDSLTAIDRLRGSRRPNTLERTAAVFVTTNRRLVLASRQFFEETRRSAAVGHCVLELDLCAQLFVRRPSARPDMPKVWLIANACAAQRLSPEFLEMTTEYMARVAKRDVETTNEMVELILHTQDRERQDDDEREADLIEGSPPPEPADPATEEFAPLEIPASWSDADAGWRPMTAELRPWIGRAGAALCGILFAALVVLGVVDSQVAWGLGLSALVLVSSWPLSWGERQPYLKVLLIVLAFLAGVVGLWQVQD